MSRVLGVIHVDGDSDRKWAEEEPGSRAEAPDRWQETTWRLSGRQVAGMARPPRAWGVG